MPQAVVAGLSVSWEVFGRGPRSALFLHPGMTQGRLWREVAQPLSDRLTVTAPDLPGHGKSGWDAKGDYLRRSADVVTALCDGPVDLVGHSMGGVVALAVALDRPDLVRSLTLVEPVLFAATRGTPAFDRHLEAMAPFDAACRAGDPATAAREFLSVWGTGQTWEDLPLARQRELAGRIPLVRAAEAGLIHDSCGILASGRLEGFGRPVCLIGGDASPPVAAAILDALQARLPDAARVTVAGAGHMVTVTHPGAVAAAISACLDRSA